MTITLEPTETTSAVAYLYPARRTLKVADWLATAAGVAIAFAVGALLLGWDGLSVAGSAVFSVLIVAVVVARRRAHRIDSGLVAYEYVELRR